MSASFLPLRMRQGGRVVPLSLSPDGVKFHHMGTHVLSQTRGLGAVFDILAGRRNQLSLHPISRV